MKCVMNIAVNIAGQCAEITCIRKTNNADVSLGKVIAGLQIIGGVGRRHRAGWF